MTDSPERQRFYIHAGLPKTGTSYLQDLLFASRSALREQGLALVPRKRHDHFNLTLKVRGMLQPFDAPASHEVLERFARQVQRNEAPRALLTHETLAGAPPKGIATVLAHLRDYEVHVIVSARDLGRQIPSSWQQGIKGRRTVGFTDFLDAAVRRTDDVAGFWRGQDLPAVLDRWSAAADPARIHVITAPTTGAPRNLLVERFCSVVGLDPETLDVGSPTENPSLGHRQAELLRRVNVALGDRLPHSRTGYRRVARSFLSDRVLLRQHGLRAQLPESLRGWVDEVTETWIEQLSSGGFDVVGDIADLRTPQEAYATSAEPTEGELLESAVAALADILELRDQELDARKEERRRTAELERRLEHRESRAALSSVMRRLTRRQG